MEVTVATKGEVPTTKQTTKKAMLGGRVTTRGHDGLCRQRIVDKMRDDPELKHEVEKVEVRQSEFFEKTVKEGDERRCKENEDRPRHDRDALEEENPGKKCPKVSSTIIINIILVITINRVTIIHITIIIAYGGASDTTL